MSDVDQDVKATRTEGGLSLRVEGSSTAWLHSDAVLDLRAVR
jgi:hypothetical protein